MPYREAKEYQIDTLNVIEMFQEGYNGITFLYGLKGELNIYCENEIHTLSSGDVHIINKDLPYKLTGHGDNIVLKVSLSSHYFSRYYHLFFHYRYIITPYKNAIYINNIRSLITKLVIIYLQGNRECSELELNSCLSEILKVVVLYFKTDNHPKKKKIQYSPRIEKTIQYLHSHYQQNLSLNQVAGVQHLSVAYLSRLFTKEVGVSFKHYLTQLRFEHCVEALIATNDPIYLIAQENGFSSVRQFTALFHERYGENPNQFRQAYKQGERPDIPTSTAFSHSKESLTGEIDAFELLTQLTDSLNNNRESQVSQSLPLENIEVSIKPVQKSGDALSQQNYIISIGKLDEVLKQNIQQQIMTVKEGIGVGYVEAQHLISGDTILPEFVSDEASPTFSRYNNTDTAIAFLKQHNIALLVRIYHSNVIFNPNSYIEKLMAFIRHNINVFGPEYLQRWRFIYYSSQPEQIHSEAFRESFLHIKTKINALLPDVSIGLFYAFPLDEKEIEKNTFFAGELVRSCDFLGYSANPNEKINFAQFNDTTFNYSESVIPQKTRHIIQQLKNHNLNIPLCLLTWNTLTGNTRHTNGSFFRGALLLNTLLALPSQVDSVGFWINSETQNEAQTNSKIDISSLALFYTFNTKRPIFHVLWLRERLKGSVIARGPQYLLTRTAFGYQLMLTNTVIFNPYLSIQEHLIQSFKKQFRLDINGLTAGRYQIKKWIFDQQHGALYKQFELQHTRYGRDSEIMEYINQHSTPSLNVYDEEITGLWNVLDEMDVNAIHFYELHRVY